jgi:hypothetical protein
MISWYFPHAKEELSSRIHWIQKKIVLKKK